MVPFRVKIGIVPKGTMATFYQISPQNFEKTADFEEENGIFSEGGEYVMVGRHDLRISIYFMCVLLIFVSVL